MPQIEVSETAFEYLKSIAIPLTDTTVTVVDKLIERVRSLESVTGPQPDRAPKKLHLQFAGEEVPSVKFGVVMAAKVDGKPVKKYWNSVLEALIARCVQAGHSTEEVRLTLNANTLDGAVEEGGYRYVQEAGFSFQGLEANRVCKNIALLCERYDIPVEIEIRWQDVEEAAFPNQSARLVFP